MAVKSAGQLPTGFDPADLYNARFHPRALQLAVIGASDAVQSMGIPWSEITRTVPPDQISVYASNVMSQMDEPGRSEEHTSELQSRGHLVCRLLLVK